MFPHILPVPAAIESLLTKAKDRFSMLELSATSPIEKNPLVLKGLLEDEENVPDEYLEEMRCA